MAIAVEHQYPSRALRRSFCFLENRAQPDIVKRDREFVLPGEALDLLLPLACAHAPRPQPRKLRIVNRANLLSLEFGFNQVGKLAHQRTASPCLQPLHIKAIQFISKVLSAPRGSVPQRNNQTHENYFYSMLREYPYSDQAPFFAFRGKAFTSKITTSGDLFQVMNKKKVAAGGTRKSNSRRRTGTNGARRDAFDRRNERPTRSAAKVRRGNGEFEIVELTKGERTELALRRSEERYRILFDLVPVAVYACDADGVIHEYNRRAVELWGREPERNGAEPRFCGSYKIYYPDGRPMPHQDCPMARALHGEELGPKDLEIVVERPNGERRHVIPAPRVLKNRRDEIIGAINCLYDVTALKKAEAELKRSKEMLENLVQQRTKALRAANAELENEIMRRKGLEGQILEISDREQERLGQELHDGLCQQLTAIGFLVRATALRLNNHRVVHQEDLEKIAQLINSSVMDARNIARDLHKEEIGAPEFVPALRNMVERKIWKTPCRLKIKTELNIEDDRVASQLYRILREALINANKHARATQIVLEVRRVKDELIFSVTDNGVGLLRKPKAGHGLGFHIMQYRAQSIGARLEFESRKKSGSRVGCYLPLSVIK